MPLQRFIPSSSDRYISNDKNQGAVKFGHLNAVVDYINETVVADGLQLEGDGPLSTTPRLVTDAAGNTSKLKLSTQQTQIVGTLMFPELYSGDAGIIITTAGQVDPATFPSQAGATISIGTYYNQNGTDPLTVGYGNTYIGIYQAAMGADNSYFNTMIGYAASITVNQPGNVVIGKSATSTTANATAIGRNASVLNNAENASAIGFNASTSTTYGFAIGDINSKLQIGGNFVPTARVHVKGLGSTSATTSLLVQNSSGTDLLKVQDDGKVGIGTNAPIRKIHVSDNVVGDGPALFEKDVVGGNCEVFAYNKNGSVNLTLGQLASSITMGGYFNSTYSPGSQEICSIWSIYRGDGTTRKGMLQFRTHDSSGLFPAITIDEFSKVGIGKNATTPLAGLHVTGSGSTSATTALLVQNGSGSTILQIKDNGDTNLTGSVTLLGNVTLGNFASTVTFVSGFNNTFVQNRLSFYQTNTNIRGINAGGQGLIISKNTGLTDLYPTALLAIDSTTQGFLPPRMTTAEKTAISTPAAGLVVYDNTLNQLSYFNGTSWVNV